MIFHLKSQIYDYFFTIFAPFGNSTTSRPAFHSVHRTLFTFFGMCNQLQLLVKKRTSLMFLHTADRTADCTHRCISGRISRVDVIFILGVVISLAQLRHAIQSDLFSNSCTEWTIMKIHTHLAFLMLFSVDCRS